MLRLVLDTNVWLDWLVFDDPAIAPLRAAVHEGRATVYWNDACAEELRRVLAYPLSRRTLDDMQQNACYAEASARATLWSAGGVSVTLPRCADPDDQKFLELAHDCAAHGLVTKDRALLELPGRSHLGFRILHPQRWSSLADPDSPG